ncbi:hypothetical protein BD410DRAFT_463755 [Rickenella mellea]|uniref:Transmembrane protein n=1 Tax=Rickenella mellea TaxID=50990 RepID=A0A4Y7PTL0_9AGAM|nr:hypothetical protein BD410DRAFT_463755 [Rickenella mellea]
MGGFLVIGTCVAIAHHFFCMRLSGRPTSVIKIEFTSSFINFTIDSIWALTIGNGLAWLVQFLFTLSIGEVMCQRFWHLLHAKSFDLEKVDDIYQIKTTFWKPSVWHHGTGLSILAATLLAMSATLGTFTSPALSVGPMLLNGPCNLTTVDLGRSELIVGGFATPAMQALGSALGGVLTVGTSTDGETHSTNEDTLVMYSPLGNYTVQSWAINGDLLTILPLLMRNINIGLLAKSVAANTASSTLPPVSDGHCSVETIVYKYNHLRLLIIYGVGILVPLICAVFGIHSIFTGKGGSMSFKSMMLAILNRG